MRILLLLLSTVALAAVPAVAQTPSAAATDGQVTLAAGFSPDPYLVPVGAGGPVDVNVPGCGFGYVSEAPDYKLHYSASGGAALTLSATSDDDTTILVNLPGGSWMCDDDSGGGGDPRLTIPNAPSGRYDIWVGTYSQRDGVRAALSISGSASSGSTQLPPTGSTPPSASSGTPNPGAPATDGQVTLTAGFSPDPYLVPVGAGGPVDVNVTGCRLGYVSIAPDFKVHYSASGGEDLTLSATSDDDTTILVHLPDGSWVCDDDGGDGNNPRLTVRNASSGRYDIWVGTYSQRDGVRAALSISDSRSSGSATPSAGSGTPNPNATATDGQVTLTAGFSPDPYTVPVGAGGPVDVRVPGCGFGFVSDAPDFKVHYSASGGEDLTLSATSDDDTTILVHLPDGSWVCDDDGGDGNNPRLTVRNASSGRYDIWVGTYSQRDGVRAALSISDSASSGSVATPESPSATTVAASWATQATSYRGQNGTRYVITCPAGGTPSSRLWGSNPYTDDSSICTAGVHAGVITAAGGGQMTIEIRPGQSSYARSTSHGLTSGSWGSWSGSFFVIR